MLDLAIFTILCLIWGSTWLAIKIGLDGSPPFLGAGFRFAIATIILYILTALFRKWDFSFRRSWPYVIITGILTYPVAYSLVYWGEQYVESGLAAVLFAIMPFFVASLAHFFIRGERLTIFKIVGMLIGFCGILLIFADSLKINGGMEIWGMICIMASSLSAGASLIMMKKYLHDFNPLPITAFQTSLGAVILLLLGICLEPLSGYRTDIKTLGSLLYLGIIGTSVAFSLYLYLIRKMEATRISMIAFITPVIAMFLGVLFRGEDFDNLRMLGSLLVILGVFAVVMGDGLKARIAGQRTA